MIVEHEYYSKKEYLSNSFLTSIKDKYYGNVQTEAQFQGMKRAFYEGGLFDDSVTLSVKNGFTFVPREYKNKLVSKEVLQRTRAMIEVLKSDSFIWSLIEESEHQVPFYSENFQFNHIAFNGVCKFKGLLDFLYKDFIACDLKSTVCKTQDSFEKAIFHFGYDRQGASYMDLSGVDKYLIFAVSKKNLKLFKYFIDRDSDVYRNAVIKRDSLIFKSMFVQ